MTGMRMTLKTTGFDKYLEKAADSVRDIDGLVDNALAAGAKVALAGMQKRVPIDTGNLYNHLRIVGPTSIGNYHYVRIEVDFTDRESILYAVYVEFGTPHRVMQSFVRATFNDDKNAIQKAIRDVLKGVEVPITEGKDWIKEPFG